MSATYKTSRRRFLKTTAALGGMAALNTSLPIGSALAATSLTVGFIYVGPKDDFGYNQAHAEGAAAVKALDKVKVIEEENVAETVDVQKSMESMINFDGATLLFPTSFGYFDPHILKVAPKYPKVRFQHAAGLWSADKHPKNVGSYFGYIGMGQYLNGIVAGHTSERPPAKSRIGPPFGGLGARNKLGLLTPSCRKIRRNKRSITKKLSS